MSSLSAVPKSSTDSRGSSSSNRGNSNISNGGSSAQIPAAAASSNSPSQRVPIKLDFQLRAVSTEDHVPRPVFCVRFCDIVPSMDNRFASVGANYVTIYQIIKPACTLEVLQGMLDEDTEEDFYTCTWCIAGDSAVTLAVAGLRGTIKCIDIAELRVKPLLGHGNHVNDLRTHPINDGFIFSASKDESVRMWNVTTGVCVAMFCGEQGHREDVLCIDVHPTGNCIVSAGMDTSIKIWNLDEPILKVAIEKSAQSQSPPPGESKGIGKLAFEPIYVQIPIFSTTQVHKNYVDSVRWVGNCILSKSTRDRIVLWTPDSNRYKGAPLILREFAIKNSGNLWFIRMDVCIPLDIFAVGNKDGRVFIHNLHSSRHSCNALTAASSGSGGAKGFDAADGAIIDGGNNDLDSEYGSSILGAEKTISSQKGSKPVKEWFESTGCPPCAELTHFKAGGTVRQVAFHPSGDYVIYSCDIGAIAVWSISITDRALVD